MKKIIVIIAFVLTHVVGTAQYYNQYGNSQAFEYGMQMMEQAQRNYQTQLQNNPTLMAGAMIQAIANGQDETAYTYAEYLAENRGSAADWYWLGVLNEAGIYQYDIDYATRCYRAGARKRNGAMCTQRLNEIAAGNELSAQNVRSHCAQIVAYGSSASLPDFSSGSSSSSRRKSSGSCPRCHGSGVDPSPVAVGDPYMGANIASQGLVGYTHTNGGRCPYCGKYEYHVHYKCQSSTYHPAR